MIAFALREIRRSLRDGKLRTLMAVVTATIAFLIFNGSLLAAHNLVEGVDRFRSQAKVNVILANGTEPVALAARIGRLPGVAEAVATSSTQALEYFRRAQGAEAARGIVEALGASPFPAFIEVKVAPSVTDVAPLARELERLPGVEEVLYGAETGERLGRLAAALRRATTVVNLFMTVFVLLIVVNSVRATVHARDEELYVMRLCGASDALLLSPFALEGALVAGVSILLSWGLLAAAGKWLAARLPFLPLSFVPNETVAGVVVLALAVGALGGLIAAREALNLREDDL